MTTNTTHSAIEIALAEKGTAPDWIQLFPAGPKVTARDGREWRMDNPDTVIAAFKTGGQPLPLDYEHASQHKASQGEPAPAAGWIEELENRGGAIWARIDWTAKGREAVAAREYRFVSPGFMFDKITKVINSLIHAGLTNQPALKMAALAKIQPENEDTPMALKPVTDALDLVDGASTDQIVAAIAALKSDKETALASVATPDPEKFVGKPLLDAALAQVKTFEDAANEARDTEITEAVDALIAAGDPNHPPANRDKYLAMCRMDGGFDLFKQLYKPNLETALTQVETADKAALGKADGALSAEEKAVCQLTGMSEEEFLEEKAKDEA